MKYQNHNFDQSSYERPHCQYHCGRQRFWKKSCRQGPDHKGRCGGHSECNPIKVGDHYECTRPEHAGGPCQSPNPDGSCSQQHSPCQPVRNLKFWRRHISYLVVVAVIVLIFSFSFAQIAFFKNTGIADIMLNPGPLSAQHATFTGQQSCQNCHTNHKDNFSDWFMSAFQHNDLTAACTECHLFAGDARVAHQGKLSNDRKTSLAEHNNIECVRCHTEHQGKTAELTHSNNQTCSNCHQNSFSDFATKHPPFAKHYPYRQRQAIYFDHLKHLEEYFIEEQYLTIKRDVEFAKQASQSCSSCHNIKNAQRAVKPKSYTQICQGCHDYQIKENQLTLLTTDLELAELSPITLSLMDESITEDPDQAATIFLEAIAKGEMKSLFNLSEQQIQQLWLGFNPIEAQLVAKSWASGESYAPEIDDKEDSNKLSGWFFGEDSNGDEAIFYKPKGHADIILRSWIEQLLLISRNKSNEHIEAAVEQLMEQKGPGSCGKCHAAGLNDKQLNQSSFQFSWGYASKSETGTILYSHKPHINLMGSEEGCDNCHQFNRKADTVSYYKNRGKNPYEYQNPFSDIRKESCSECHTQDQIVSDCTTCHRYHGPSSYKIGFISKPHIGGN